MANPAIHQRYQRAKPSPSWILWLIGVQLGVIYAPTLLWLWDRWTFSVWHNVHGLIIVPVIGYLIWRTLRGYQGTAPRASVLGFAFLVPALVLQALDAGMHTQLLSAVSLVVAMPGLSLLFLGVERTRAIAFPLAFFAFALPIPLALTESLQMVLRQIATVSAAELAPVLGVSVFAEETMLHTPAASLQISDACSGFSTLYAAVAMAFLAAYGCPSTVRRYLVILIAPVVAIGANILRVLLLVLLVQWWGGDILDTSMHELSGLLAFAVTIPIVFWIGQ